MGGATGFTVLVMALGLGTAIFWMVVGWRAMIAHEKIAESVSKWTGKQAGHSESS